MIVWPVLLQRPLLALISNSFARNSIGQTSSTVRVAVSDSIAWKPKPVLERVGVMNVLPQQYLNQDLVLANPVDSQQQQASGTYIRLHVFEEPADTADCESNSAGQVNNKVTVAQSATCASTKVISGLSKWEYHVEAFLTLWQWNKEFKQRSMDVF